MVKGKNSFYSSNAGYFKVEFKCPGAKYLEANFRTIRINNQIDRHFPLVFLEFFIDNQVFIEYNLYPQSEITMNLYYSDEENKVYGQPLIFNLIILEMNVDLPQKYINNVTATQNADIQRQKTVITCVPKQCHELLNVTINGMWENPVTVQGAVMGVIGEVNPKSKIVDTRKMNTALLEQFIIPPMSFKNFFTYMDETYGVYKGKLFYYVNYNGTFMMWELKTKWDDFGNGGLYTVHKMPSYSTSDAVYVVPANLARSTPNNYVTYNNMKTICMTNDPFVPNGGQQLHVFHPNWDISKLVVSDPIGEATTFGIHSSKKDLKTNNGILKKRICAFDDNLGDENGSTYDKYITANYIDPAYKMNFLQLKLLRKIKPHIVMKVGQPFYLKTYAEQEKYPDSDYEGKYLVTESILQLTRNQGSESGHDTVFATCEITGVRTSQSHS